LDCRPKTALKVSIPSRVTMSPCFLSYTKEFKGKSASARRRVLEGLPTERRTRGRMSESFRVAGAHHLVPYRSVSLPPQVPTRSVLHWGQTAETTCASGIRTASGQL